MRRRGRIKKRKEENQKDDDEEETRYVREAPAGADLADNRMFDVTVFHRRGANDMRRHSRLNRRRVRPR